MTEQSTLLVCNVGGIPIAREEGVDLDAGRYDLLKLPDRQDLASCLDNLPQLTPVVSEWTARGAPFQVVVDFTGGIKCMQVALQEGHGVESTEKVPLERVPDSLRSAWATRANEGIVALGLQDAYALFAGLNDSADTKLQSDGLSGTTSPLVARNRSILTYGFERVSGAVFDKLWTSALSLAGVDATNLPRFPTLAEAGNRS